MSTSAGKPLRVMQSFGRPRATTNPYIHMLDAALTTTAGIEHLRWHRARALLGRYDAVQFHWPELLFGGSTRPRALAHRAFATALRIRLSLTRVAVLRTMHNLEPHAGTTRWQRRYLDWLDRRTDHRILLNEHTPMPPGAPATLIPHGHYRDWFSAVERVDPQPGVLGFVGLIRRYKGVEGLLDAFAKADSIPESLTLQIFGKPESQEVEDDLRSRARADSRVRLNLGYLSEDDFATSILACSGIVLPYRHMHNSGALLAALSLSRPVLVPQTPTNKALSSEVGSGWVTTYDDPLTAPVLLAFAAQCADPPTVPPDLSGREWDQVGTMHRDAFALAVAHRKRNR